MRKIQNKNASNLPLSLKSDATKQEQNRIAKEQDRTGISEKIYKGEKVVVDDANDPYYGQEEFEVRYRLRQLFYNKCAYCECVEYKPDVEHYRPKKRVTGVQRNNHGYYWLCYEWTNLLPACSACNSRSGKWDKFPVAGQRVLLPPFDTNNNLDIAKCSLTSTYLTVEQPLLLNPEVDEPTDFFKLLWNGRLAPKNENDQKAEASIRVYDLNRGNLIAARKKIVDELRERMMEHFVAFRRGIHDAEELQSVLKLSLENFKKDQAPITAYSFVAYYICEHFEEFVEYRLSALSELEARLLLQTFETLS